ncbi:MAG TPA: DUF2301 domain-containing membrane protein [Trichocoleus sp.]
MATQAMAQAIEPIYQGQFGEFIITSDDRRSVIIYRSGLMIAALSFAIGSALVLWQSDNAVIQSLLTPLFASFTIGLGISLFTIHIYLAALHRTLQIFWGIGTIASLLVAYFSPEPFALTAYHYPLTILGIGFTFAALTGIFFKEAFCFNRLETKLLTPIVPLLLLGHLSGILPATWEQILLGLWAALFVIFALRKAFQAIPPDIGDKSVFVYLKQKSTPA